MGEPHIQFCISSRDLNFSQANVERKREKGLAMSSPNKNKKYQKSPQAQRKFAFDLNKPIMTGYLGKQGELFGVTFKQTFFILYPGFLVYYSDKDTWRYDLQRGETLGVSINTKQDYKLMIVFRFF